MASAEVPGAMMICPDVTVEAGDRVTHTEPERGSALPGWAEYLTAQVDCGMYALVALDDGNRWRNPIHHRGGGSIPLHLLVGDDPEQGEWRKIE